MRAFSRRTLLLVGLVWIVFLSKAVFYASVLPLWEGYDEFSHFDFVQCVAINRQLPTVQANGSREISESLRVAPPSVAPAAGPSRRTPSRRLLAPARCPT